MFIEIIPNWHPIFVHFTIALFTTATLLIAGSLVIKGNFGGKILECGYLNLWIGCLFTFITVGAGFYAYNTVAHDEPSHLAMTNHKNWAIATASIFLFLTLWSVKLYHANQKQNKFFIICLLAATGVLSITGWKGAEVVYRYGLGVMSMPNSDAHQHKSGEKHDHSSHSHEATEAEVNEDDKNIKDEVHNHTKNSHQAVSAKNTTSIQDKKQSNKQQNNEEEEEDHEGHSHSH